MTFEVRPCYILLRVGLRVRESGAGAVAGEASERPKAPGAHESDRKYTVNIRDLTLLYSEI